MYMGHSDGSKIMYNSNFRSEDSRIDLGGKVRTILHCDADSFFATCETVLHPEYASVPMAVCGSVEDRHGIVLAKNQLAKKYNIFTGETIWSAKQKCPSLLTVRPTYALYIEMSEKMNRIFYDYTDKVEAFGMDESWLDVTGSLGLFGSGREIADSIRGRVKRELGITVSVGVSFNKVFAKLGSDMNKPDGTFVIPPERFASVVWKLPVSALLFVGPSCAKMLARVGITTIGDLAVCDADFIKSYMGKSGAMLRDFALGRDYAEVSVMGYEPKPKSVSNGMTFRANLITPEDVSFAVTYLSMSVAERLRRHRLCCNTVSVIIRDPDMSSINRSARLSHPTCLYEDISSVALSLINANRNSDSEIYSVSVHAEKLTENSENEEQQQFFVSQQESEYKKRYSLETAIDSIRARYGKSSIGIASAINNHLIG